MNLAFKIFSELIIKINQMIDSLSLQTQETIKKSYILLIVIFIIVGIITGYNRGKDAAKIKSAPLAEYVNDIFKVDINHEKKGGDFSEMLESELMKESEINNFKKYGIPLKNNLDTDRNIYEDESPINIKEPTFNPVIEKESVLELKSNIIEEDEPQVKHLEKNKTKIKKDVTLLNDESKKGSEASFEEENSEVKLLNKNRKIETDIIKNNKGIVDR